MGQGSRFTNNALPCFQHTPSAPVWYQLLQTLLADQQLVGLSLCCLQQPCQALAPPPFVMCYLALLHAAAAQGVPRGVLQLVAVACIMLAAKQDEVGRQNWCALAPAPSAVATFSNGSRRLPLTQQQLQLGLPSVQAACGPTSQQWMVWSRVSNACRLCLLPAVTTPFSHCC